MVSEEITLRSDQSYSIIGKFKEKLLLYQDKGTEFHVQAYNDVLGLSWSKELELDKKRPNVLDVIGLEDYFYVIYQYKSKGQTIIKVHKYNEGANLVDSTIVFNYGKRFASPTPTIAVSEDKKKVLLYHTEYFSKIEVAVFDLGNMEPMWNKTYNPKDLNFGNDFQQILVDNQGGMHMVFIRDNERLKKDKLHHFEFLYQDPNIDIPNTYLVGMQGKLSYDSYFKVDNVNRNIVAGGMYSEKNKGRTQGYYYLKVPINDPLNHIVSFQPYELAFMEQLVDKKAKVTKGLFDVGIQDIALRQDGGIIIICEQRKDFERTPNSTRTPSRFYTRDLGRYSVDHYYEDLFLFSVHPEGKHHWETILHKKQFSQDDDAAFSSFFLVKTTSKLRLVYNDEIRNENTVSEYVIKGSGIFDRNSILNTASQELRLRFRQSKQVAANEIIVPSERKSRLKLVRMVF
jgi:hypothetical protein